MPTSVSHALWPDSLVIMRGASIATTLSGPECSRTKKRMASVEVSRSERAQRFAPERPPRRTTTVVGFWSDFHARSIPIKFVGIWIGLRGQIALILPLDELPPFIV